MIGVGVEASSKGEMKTLAEMAPGQSGTIRRIDGGHAAVERLAALGILPGQRVVKVSGMILRGPVTLRINQTQVAIGYGMARKVLVEPDPT
ncbi:MAG: ferrous iron transport protein A [Kiritimatiellae bacterium]|nr:ferrous iron transport protein A [Kiritimatiellia bacterium]